MPTPSCSDALGQCALVGVRPCRHAVGVACGRALSRVRRRPHRRRRTNRSPACRLTMGRTLRDAAAWRRPELHVMPSNTPADDCVSLFAASYAVHDHGDDKEFPAACRPRRVVPLHALPRATLRGDGGDSVSASGDAGERRRPRTAWKALADHLRKRPCHAKGLTRPLGVYNLLEGPPRHTSGSTKRLRRGRKTVFVRGRGPSEAQ